MPFNTDDKALRDNSIRKGEFREVAREIVAKDRDARKYGYQIDTGGSITRAMERAYKLGLSHGLNPDQIPPPPPLEDQNAPISWNTIPPKPRNQFERISRFRWIVILVQNAAPWERRPDKWACYWDWGEKTPPEKRIELADTLATSTLEPLISLGLMSKKEIEGKIFLVPTIKGMRTWDEAVANKHVRNTSKDGL